MHVCFRGLTRLLAPSAHSETEKDIAAYDAEPVDPRTWSEHHLQWVPTSMHALHEVAVEQSACEATDNRQNSELHTQKQPQVNS